MIKKINVSGTPNGGYNVFSLRACGVEGIEVDKSGLHCGELFEHFFGYLMSIPRDMVHVEYAGPNAHRMNGVFGNLETIHNIAMQFLVGLEAKAETGQEQQSPE